MNEITNVPAGSKVSVSVALVLNVAGHVVVGVLLHFDAALEAALG